MKCVDRCHPGQKTGTFTMTNTIYGNFLLARNYIRTQLLSDVFVGGPPNRFVN